MKTDLDQYLDKIQQDESIFPMDSPSKRKVKRKIVRNVYPESYTPNTNTEKKRLMIDFDGVISQYKNGWNNGKLTDDPMENVKESIDYLKNEGYEIIIFTTRASKTHNTDPTAEQLVADLQRWLKEHDIYYDAITSEKLGALAYIDDKAIRFTSWTDVIKQIKNIE